MELKKTTLTCEQAFWHDFLNQQKEKQLKGKGLKSPSSFKKETTEGEDNQKKVKD